MRTSEQREPNRDSRFHRLPASNYQSRPAHELMRCSHCPQVAAWPRAEVSQMARVAKAKAFFMANPRQSVDRGLLFRHRSYILTAARSVISKPLRVELAAHMRRTQRATVPDAWTLRFLPGVVAVSKIIPTEANGLRWTSAWAVTCTPELCPIR